MFHSFAICCKDLCSVIGPASTEEVILCKDEIWGVRKDLDDVKTGVLAHLSEFFEMLPSDVRKENFPSILNGILDTENERNWRYRDSLADSSFVESKVEPVGELIVLLIFDTAKFPLDTFSGDVDELLVLCDAV
uniref:Uncharacterized protein n=1 Tax=Amphimedon queenslandica TaxID=400682 RepID=A0A1X7TE80_AMPQE